MKRDIVSAYVHMKRDTPFPLLDDSPPPPSIALVKYIRNGWPISQPKDK